jgi:hypothetical protein
MFPGSKGCSTISRRNAMAAKPTDPNEIGESPIVSITNANIPDGPVMLSGFLEGPFYKKANEKQHDDYRFRLYSSAALDDFVEIAYADIVWLENYPAPATGAPVANDPKNMERTTIWVRRDAKVSIGSFVVGDIVTRYMPQEDAITSLVRVDDQTRLRIIAGSGAGCGSYAVGAPCPTKYSRYCDI